MLEVTTPHGTFEVSRWSGHPLLDIRSKSPGVKLGEHNAYVSARLPTVGRVREEDLDVQGYIWHPSGNGGSGRTTGALTDPAARALAVTLVTAVRAAVAVRPPEALEFVDVAIETAQPTDLWGVLSDAETWHELEPWGISRTKTHVVLSAPVATVVGQDRAAELAHHAARVADILAELGVPARVSLHTYWHVGAGYLPMGPLTVTAEQLETVAV